MIDLQETITVDGYVFLLVCHEGKVIDLRHYRNITTSAGKNMIVTALDKNSNENTKITYVEVGTGETAATVADTDLETPVARTPVEQVVHTSINRLYFTAHFSGSATNQELKEVGIFGGPLATTTTGSGVMFARAALDYDNTTDQHDLLIAWRVTIG